MGSPYRGGHKLELSKLRKKEAIADEAVVVLVLSGTVVELNAQRNVCNKTGSTREYPVTILDPDKFSITRAQIPI